MKNYYILFLRAKLNIFFSLSIALGFCIYIYVNAGYYALVTIDTSTLSVFVEAYPGLEKSKDFIINESLIDLSEKKLISNINTIVKNKDITQIKIHALYADELSNIGNYLKNKVCNSTNNFYDNKISNIENMLKMSNHDLIQSPNLRLLIALNQYKIDPFFYHAKCNLNIYPVKKWDLMVFVVTIFLLLGIGVHLIRHQIKGNNS
jgi:hypothetical protein